VSRPGRFSPVNIKQEDVWAPASEPVPAAASDRSRIGTLTCYIQYREMGTSTRFDG